MSTDVITPELTDSQKKFGRYHNFGKPFGYAVVTVDGGYLNGGIFHSKRDAEKSCEANHEPGTNEVIPLAAADTFPVAAQLPRAKPENNTVTVDGLSVKFVLATGQVIHVRIDEEGAFSSAPGLRLQIVSERHALLITPSSSNAFSITTARALAEHERLVAAAVAERDATKVARK